MAAPNDRYQWECCIHCIRKYPTGLKKPAIFDRGSINCNYDKEKPDERCARCVKDHTSHCEMVAELDGGDCLDFCKLLEWSDLVANHRVTANGQDTPLLSNKEKREIVRAVFALGGAFKKAEMQHRANWDISGRSQFRETFYPGLIVARSMDLPVLPEPPSGNKQAWWIWYASQKYRLYPDDDSFNLWRDAKATFIGEVMRLVNSNDDDGTLSDSILAQRPVWLSPSGSYIPVNPPVAGPSNQP